MVRGVASIRRRGSVPVIPSLHTSCAPCFGTGVAPNSVGWIGVCRPCDGSGYVDKPGGPRFGAQLALTDRQPGELVELVTGERAVIAWHQPKPAPKVTPIATFVRIVDEFDDHVGEPIAYPAQTGVRRVLGGRSAAAQLDDGAGAKAADELDPFTRRATAGALL
jgi:hypothetical protein